MTRTKAECLAAAGRSLAAAHERFMSLDARTAAEEAYQAGGPSIDELEVRIRARREASLEHAS